MALARQHHITGWIADDRLLGPTPTPKSATNPRRRPSAPASPTTTVRCAAGSRSRPAHAANSENFEERIAGDSMESGTSMTAPSDKDTTRTNND